MNEVNSQEINKANNKNLTNNNADLSRNQVILYFIIVSVSITIFIISMFGINLFILLIIIGVVLVYVYLDKDIQDNEDSES